MAALELRIPPVVIVLLLAVAMWLTGGAVPEADFMLPHAPLFVAVLFLSGILIAVSGVIRFRAQGTTVHPGKPEDATALVRDGVYRYTRNPMYLGLLLCLGAWGAYLENGAALFWPGVFVVYMTRFQIQPEERMLLAKFGDEYADYRSRTRRWL